MQQVRGPHVPGPEGAVGVEVSFAMFADQMLMRVSRDGSVEVRAADGRMVAIAMRLTSEEHEQLAEAVNPFEGWAVICGALARTYQIQ